MPSLEELIYSVGGGQYQQQSALDAFLAAQAAELARRGMGQGLLDFITETQRNPFSIVPALQQYTAAGGGPLASAAAFAGTGGAGSPSPYGAIAQQLIEGLAEFTGGTPYDPNTGRNFTPGALAWLRQGMMSGNPQEFFSNAQRYFNQGAELDQGQTDYLSQFPTAPYFPTPGPNPGTGFQTGTNRPTSPFDVLIGTPPSQPPPAAAAPQGTAQTARRTTGSIGGQPRRSANRYLRTRFGL